MTVKLTDIQMDVSIQCRASIDTATVSEYAERMTEGDEFPPIVVFGTDSKCWIADGWHRVMAARQIGAVDIPAELRQGGRVDALRAALAANATNGRQRTPDDKRRAVQVCVTEFPHLTQQAVAELVGCDRVYVKRITDQLVTSHKLTLPATRTGQDGKERPTSYARRVAEEEEESSTPTANGNRKRCYGCVHLHLDGDATYRCMPRDKDVGDGSLPLCGGSDWEYDDEEGTEQEEVKQTEKVTGKRPVGMIMAMDAINILRRIPEADPMRLAGLAEVAKYIKHTQKGSK